MPITLIHRHITPSSVLTRILLRCYSTTEPTLTPL
nr:ankyrin repeat family protein [Oriental turtle dovepox virus]